MYPAPHHPSGLALVPPEPHDPPRLTCTVPGGFTCSPPLLMARPLRAGGSSLPSFSPSPAPGVSDCET